MRMELDIWLRNVYLSQTTGIFYVQCDFFPYETYRNNVVDTNSVIRGNLYSFAIAKSVDRCESAYLHTPLVYVTVTDNC